MSIQEQNQTILHAIRKAITPTQIRGQIVYIRELNGDIVYSTCGYAPLGGGILNDLKGINMYDVITALFEDKMGYQITVGPDRNDGALTVKMWRTE